MVYLPLSKQLRTADEEREGEFVNRQQQSDVEGVRGSSRCNHAAFPGTSGRRG